MAGDKAKEGDLALFNQLVSGALPAGTPPNKPAPKIVETQPKRESKAEKQWLSVLNDALFTPVEGW
jgi:hypothetical protein